MVIELILNRAVRSVFEMHFELAFPVYNSLYCDASHDVDFLASKQINEYVVHLWSKVLH